MAELIRWEETHDGAGVVLNGYAGEAGPCLFQMHGPWSGTDVWTLQSWLPGQRGHHRGEADGELKARAEELLREFASSVGAVFPGDLGEQFWRDTERRKIQTVATANARDDCIALLRDKADEVGRQGAVIRARVYCDAADLIEGKS